MRNDYNRLSEIRARFQPLIDNPDFLYTYIGPKDRKKYQIFERYVSELPTFGGSMYEILSDANAVRSALRDLQMLEDCELDIYIASNDSYSSVVIQGTLADYIKRQGLAFRM